MTGISGISPYMEISTPNSPAESDYNKLNIEKYVNKINTDGVAAAAFLLPISMILGISNYTGFSTSLWGITWKMLAFAGLCALGYQSKKNSEVKESIQSTVREIAEASLIDKSKPIVVFINPQESSASLIPSIFYNESYKEQIEKLSEIFQIYILEPINELTLLESLNQFKSKSIKTMCIRAHAGPSKMEIAPELILSASHNNIIAMINDKMAKDSHIILLGCCTAKGQENIAKDISSICTDSTIYGAKDYIMPAGAQINVNGSHKLIIYDTRVYAKEGKASLEVYNIKDLTCKYFNGISVD